jgi:hypothetical protein
MKNKLVCTATLTLACALAPAVNATDYTWTGAVSSSMNDPANYKVNSSGMAATALPTQGDVTHFSIPVGDVANLPVNNVHQARLGELVFKTSGYVVEGSEIHAYRIRVEPNLTLTYRAPIGWNQSDAHRIYVNEGAKFIFDSTFGTRGGGASSDLYAELGTGAEFVYARGGGPTRFDWSSSSGFTISLDSPNRLDMYLLLSGNGNIAPRIRTSGGPGALGSSNKVAWECTNLRIGGPGSGDISQTSVLEPNWGSGKSLYVEDIVYRLSSIWTDERRSSGSGDFYKRGNGVFTITHSSGLSQGGQNNDRSMNGLNFRLMDGTTCINSNFWNYSYTQNNLEGLNVAAAARIEGVGRFITRAPNDTEKNKSAVIYGTIAPGCSHVDESSAFGTLAYVGTNFTFKSGSTLEIKASRAAHDTLAVDAQPIVIEAGAALAVSHFGRLSAVEPFVILDNRGDAAIVGAFDGLPEGALFDAASDAGATKRYRISYVGGDGNDIAMIPVPESMLIIIN